MTELEMMRWILGILVTAGALAVTVMYFFRDDENTAVVAVEVGDSRSMLQQTLMSSSSSDKSGVVPSAIFESDVYEALQQNIRNRSIVKESSPIWTELEKTVAESSPKFKSNLYVLAGGDLKPSDLHMALLIKCGVSPANIATLVGRSKSTITFRRKDMGKKFFDQDLDANAVDELLRLL